jgi:hypothetical protein
MTDWLMTTAAMYRRAAARAGTLTLANWPVLVTLFVYSVVMTGAILVGSLLGFVGGLLVSLVWASCVGSLLYLVEMMVRTSRVTIEDFRRSFGAYLADVLGVVFVLWLFFMLVTPALRTLDQGPVLILSLYLVLFVFFNAVPELIYLGHFSSLQLLRESYVFIGENWVEWFPPNVALALVLYGIASVELAGPLGWAQAALIALLLYFTMVLRGLLFLDLHGSTRRARVFRHRMGG